MSSAAPVRRPAALAPGIKDDRVAVIENIVVWISAAFGLISALATLAIVVAFVAEVIARWAGHSFDPTNVVSGLLVTAVFTGMAWTTIRGEHISIQFVTERFGARSGRVLDIVIWALGSAYLVWLVYASFETAAANTWPYPEMVPDGVSLAPRWPWRWVLAIGMLPFALVALLNLLRAILGRAPYDDVDRHGGTVPAEAAVALDVTRDEAEVASAIEGVVTTDADTEGTK